MSDEDIFDMSDDDEVPSQAEATQKRQAAAQRKAEKELQALNAELEELRAFKTERVAAERTNAVTQAFTELGLNPKHAKFYQGEGDVTIDAVKAWAVSEDFLQVDASEDQTPAPTGFTPTVIEGSQAPGSKVYPFDEWMALSQTDPDKATAIWKAGRVADAVRE